jgi:hypothetical protein
MPPHHDRRPDVLDLANARGWSHDTDKTRHGAISDQFTRDGITLTCFWTETPWADARWSRGHVAGGPDGPRGVWTVEKDGGVLAVLAS